MQFSIQRLVAYMLMYTLVGLLGGLLGGLGILQKIYGQSITAPHSSSAALFVMCAALPGYTLFSSELLPFRREASSGVSLGAYFFVKNVMSIIDMILPTTCF